MAETYTEDDELARVIQWFKNNGVSLIVGVVLGLAIIGGWQWWKARVDSRAVAAAQLYGSVIQQIDSGHVSDGVLANVDKLKQDHAKSPYAANVALGLAAQAVTAKQYDKALGQLDWVINNSGNVPTQNLARVRKARVLWATGKSDAALKLLESKHPQSFDRLYAELAGDIYAAKGDQSKAHSAYQRAMTAADPQQGVNVLQQKLAQTAAAADDQSLATSAAPAQTTAEGA